MQDTMFNKEENVLRQNALWAVKIYFGMFLHYSRFRVLQFVSDFTVGICC